MIQGGLRPTSIFLTKKVHHGHEWVTTTDLSFEVCLTIVYCFYWRKYHFNRQTTQMAHGSKSVPCATAKIDRNLTRNVVDAITTVSISSSNFIAPNPCY